MDAVFGEAKLYENQDTYKESMDTLNLLVVGQPGFTAPLGEEAKVNLSEQDWEQGLGSANRWGDSLVNKESDNEGVINMLQSKTEE